MFYKLLGNYFTFTETSLCDNVHYDDFYIGLAGDESAKSICMAFNNGDDNGSTLFIYQYSSVYGYRNVFSI